MRSLILLTIDAWRADFADAFAGVPLLPSLAGRPHARLTRLSANGPWTSPALISLFTGEPVLQHGVHHAWDAPRRDSVGLAQVFRDHGAHVPDLCYLNRVLNYHHLGYPPDTAPPPPTSPDDPVIFDAITDAAARKSPSFLWYHYKYVHLPYWPAVEFRRLFGVEDVPARLRDSVGTGFIVPREDFTLDPADRDLVQRLYAANVRQMDAWLARVLAHLDHSGLDATVVITADHGDELLEHGHVGHASTAHHGQLHDEILRIPLFVLDPRIPTTRVVTDRAEGRDLFPTLLGLAGLPCPPTTAVDLAPALLGGDAPAADPDRLFTFHTSRWGYRTPEAMAGQSCLALTDGRHKYIRERYDADREEVYDLLADPGEQRPITDPAVLAAWRVRAEG